MLLYKYQKRAIQGLTDQGSCMSWPANTGAWVGYPIRAHEIYNLSIMKISEIYSKYKIPVILQNHMYRVAAVGRLVTESLKPEMGLEIDIVTKELLLHDMGNILKIPVNGNSLFTEEEQLHLVKVQEEFAEKYGKEEHVATLIIAKELKVPEKVTYILENTGSSKLHLTVESPDWYLKVCSYADFRVSPKKIVSITERFDEIIQRYAGREHVLADIEKTEKKKQLALVLEKQIQEKSNMSLSEISNEQVTNLVEEHRQYEI